MAHIYKITNIINDKGYVGKTENGPKKRWREHLAAARNNPIMVISKAIRKYGPENFKFEIIEECLSEDVNKKETYWIGKLDTFENGYNSTLGGDGAVGTKRERGAVHPHAKAVDCYDLKGNYLCTYDSRGEASWETGRSTNSSGINICIQGKTFQAFGHRWAWKGEPLKEVNNRINRGGKVYGIHLESGRKKMWKSQADVAGEIEGNRKANNSIGLAIERNDQPDKTKTKVKGWYLFRDKKIALSDWKPCIPRCRNMSHEERSRMSKISAEKRKIPIKGVNIKTGEEIHFNSMSEASFFLKGDGNYSATANIIANIKRLEEGKNSYCLGYKWYKR
tara:strand:- start:51 stop:1055 length:1005 start_codon:yes stop_codon:yes gene_type:complete